MEKFVAVSFIFQEIPTDSSSEAAAAAADDEKSSLDNHPNSNETAGCLSVVVLLGVEVTLENRMARQER